MPVRTRPDRFHEERRRARTRARKPRHGHAPATGGRTLARMHALEVALLRTLRERFGPASVLEDPAPFEWRDEGDGRDRFHLPLASIRRGSNDLAFVDAMPRRLLLRDPALAGTRRRLEAECAARGASYEIWTEEEIQEDRTGTQVILVADASERAAYRDALPDRDGSCPAVVGLLAERMFLADIRAVGNGWTGRSRLTGIPMAVLCGLETDPRTRMLVWRPKVPPVVRGHAGAPVDRMTETPS